MIMRGAEPHTLYPLSLSGAALPFSWPARKSRARETIFKQILHEARARSARGLYIAATPSGGLVHVHVGSLSPVIGGSSLWTAADKVIAKGKKIAAHLLEAAEADVQLTDGKFGVVGTDRTVTLKEVVRAAFQPARLPRGLEPGLYETGTFSPSQDTYPNGCHVVEVEIDPDTGAVEIVSYKLVDDVGTVINPLTLYGQIHGGIAQGLGQALMEQVVYDAESGQLLTASFMDYAMPRADTFCDIRSTRTRCRPRNRSARGGGRRTVGALPRDQRGRRALARPASASTSMPADRGRIGAAARGDPRALRRWRAAQREKRAGHRAAGKSANSHPTDRWRGSSLATAAREVGLSAALPVEPVFPRRIACPHIRGVRSAAPVQVCRFDLTRFRTSLPNLWFPAVDSLKHPLSFPVRARVPEWRSDDRESLNTAEVRKRMGALGERGQQRHPDVVALLRLATGSAAVERLLRRPRRYGRCFQSSATIEPKFLPHRWRMRRPFEGMTVRRRGRPSGVATASHAGHRAHPYPGAHGAYSSGIGAASFLNAVGDLRRRTYSEQCQPRGMPVEIQPLSRSHSTEALHTLACPQSGLRFSVGHVACSCRRREAGFGEATRY